MLSIYVNCSSCNQALEASQEQILKKFGDGVFVFPFLYRSKRLLERY